MKLDPSFHLLLETAICHASIRKWIKMSLIFQENIISLELCNVSEIFFQQM